MIICNSKKFIYIHIPKCGGTTVSSALAKRLLPQDISLNLSPHEGWDKYLKKVKEKWGLHKHSTAAEIASAMKVDNFNDYCVFTFSRNPFSRAYSAFTFTLRADARWRPHSQRHQDMKNMDFDRFMISKYMQEKSMLQTQNQLDWIEGHRANVNFFKLEEIEWALPNLMQRFYSESGNSTAKLGRLNASSEPDDWRGMSKAAADEVRKLYADDFEYFGYSKEL